MWGVRSPTVPPIARLPVVRGVCPGVTAPLEAADGMLLRLRVPGGSLSAAGLRSIAEVAERWGTGSIELTARANVQVRGLDAVDVDAASDLIVAAGLAHPDADRDGRRDVVGPPLAGHDPTELLDVSSLVAEIAAALAGADGLTPLPAKFCVTIDGGGAAGVRAIPADVALGALRVDDATVGFQVEFGRALDAGNDSQATGDRIVHIPIGAAVPLVLAAARLAAASGTRLQAPAAVAVLHDHRVATAARPPIQTRGEQSRIRSVGLLPHRRGGRASLGAAPLLGRTTPAALRVVAAIADEHAASVRLTPWRGLIITDLPAAEAPRAQAALTDVGLSSDPSASSHRVSACIGSPGCASSRADTLAAVTALLGAPDPIVRRIHLAGCEKACGAGTSEIHVADQHGHFPRIGR